jgi:hypothetical protein
MKFAAFILLSGFITYFTETIELPYKILENSKKSRCCSKTVKSICTKTNQKEGSKKSPADNCNNSFTCINCPLTYTMVLNNVGNSRGIIILSKVNHSLTPAHLATGFTSEQWKPPDIG